MGYFAAVNSVKSVGHAVARMINFLHAAGMNCSRLTLIGHSLGAHVIGIAGQKTKKTCKTDHAVGG